MNTAMTRRTLWLTVAILVGLAGRVIAQTRPAVVTATVGRAVTTLTGPWKFHVGDAARWADPDFDDSSSGDSSKQYTSSSSSSPFSSSQPSREHGF
jgi:hypothetical protein